MDGYLGSYATLALVFGAGVLVFVGAFGANRLLKPSDPAEPLGKRISYESGIDPVGGDWAQAQIRYYVYAYLYVLFAVEAVFLFPWAVKFKAFGVFGLVEMLVFLAILVVGYIWVWGKGALEWI